MSFASFALNPRLHANVAALGYQEPTPIQAQAIPLVLQGRDVLGMAQTGTGKTAAFGLPILHRLQEGPRGRLRALVVVPTRELAEQVHTAFGELGRQTGLRSVSIYGGVGIMPQVQRLRQGAEIAVACPGRLLDLIRRRAADLTHVEVLVLDEADRMFDMGFLPDIREILSRLPTQRQTLLFAATMPEDIRGLAAEVLRQPATVRIGNGTPVATVSHALYPVPQHLKTKLLVELLKHTDTASVLIFARTKHRTRRLAEQLQHAGCKVASIQGNLSQNRRREAMDGFRDGRHQILVATDIAARGIDVSSISHVINFDMPDTVDAYTHRIGRTGRAAKTGDAFTLMTREDEDTVRLIERAIGARIERRTIEGFDYSAAAPPRHADSAHAPRGPRPQRHAGSAGPSRGYPPRDAAARDGSYGKPRHGKRWGGHGQGGGGGHGPAHPTSGRPAATPGNPYPRQDQRSVYGGTYVPQAERPVVLSSHTERPPAGRPPAGRQGPRRDHHSGGGSGGRTFGSSARRFSPGRGGR